MQNNASSAGVWGDKNTQYFYNITPEKILSAVEKSGVRCTGRCLALHSMENRVYEVEIEVNSKIKSSYEKFIIVKFYRPGRWSREQIAEEHQFLSDLRGADIPAVCPIEFGGSTLHYLPEDGIYYALFPKVGGRSPGEVNEEQLIRLGRLLARTHIAAAGRQFQHRLSLTPQSYGLHNMEYLIQEKIITPELTDIFSSLVQRICEISEPLFTRFPTQRVHGDAHFGNILWRDEGISLIDFDDAVSAAPVQDLWLLVQGRDAEAQKRMRTLLCGYREIRQFDLSSLVLIESLRALRMIHYAAWIAHRRADPAFQRVFANFGTQQYWMELISDLQEQLYIIQSDNPWNAML